MPKKKQQDIAPIEGVTLSVDFYNDGNGNQMVWLSHDEGSSGAKYPVKNDLSNLGKVIQDYVDIYIR